MLARGPRLRAFTNTGDRPATIRARVGVLGQEWPREFEAFIEAADAVNLGLGNLLGAVSCSLSVGYKISLAFQMACPAAVIVAIWAACMAASTLYSKESAAWHAAVTNRAYSSTFTTLFLLYPGLCNAIFMYMKCTKVSGTWYLVADFSIECYGPKWFGGLPLALGGLAFYAIDIPVATFVVLHKHRFAIYNIEPPLTARNLFGSAQLDYQTASARLGGLVAGFEFRYFYFGVLVNEPAPLRTHAPDSLSRPN